jgi:hypothetical protein
MVHVDLAFVVRCFTVTSHPPVPRFRALDLTTWEESHRLAQLRAVPGPCRRHTGPLSDDNLLAGMAAHA